MRALMTACRYTRPARSACSRARGCGRAAVAKNPAASSSASTAAPAAGCCDSWNSTQVAACAVVSMPARKKICTLAYALTAC